jgi:hypothetical protein
VSVCVLPFTASAGPPPAASFTLIDFGGADGSAAYHEAADGRLTCSRDLDLAGRYREHLARIRAVGQPPARISSWPEPALPTPPQESSWPSPARPGGAAAVPDQETAGGQAR